MAHSRMYDDNDPYLTELREVCLTFPESAEVEAWGRPTFRAGKKLFAGLRRTRRPSLRSGVQTRPTGASSVAR